MFPRGWAFAWLLFLTPLFPAEAQAAPEVYVVQPGDTLSQIAATTGADLDALVAVNGLDSADSIVVGAVLTLPTTPPKPPAPPVTYIVAAGDTLSGIALAAGVTPQTLMDLNKLLDADRIEVGMLLLVPAG